MSGPLLELQGVGFRYPDRPVLEALDFALYAGERVALVGSNGAGKTTLLHLLVGIKRPTAGQVLAFGTRCRTESDFFPVRARVGLLFQDSDDQLFCPTVLEDVAFGPLNLGQTAAQARTAAERTLAVLGLDGFAERVTHRLSAGEKRLVALATVLAMDPAVLLLDEPTNGLDEATEERLIGHLTGLDQAMVIVSHDRRFLERLATRAVRLAEGRLLPATLHSHPHVHRHAHLHLHADGTPVDHEHDTGTPPHEDHHRATDPVEAPDRDG
jgi:cobalt/nickel transport system ATP-binding protein